MDVVSFWPTKYSDTARDHAQIDILQVSFRTKLKGVAKIESHLQKSQLFCTWNIVNSILYDDQTHKFEKMAKLGKNED